MRRTVSSSLFLVLLLITTTAMSKAQRLAGKATPPKVTIMGSELRTIKSKNTGRQYDLYIHLPTDYATETDKRYPVVYILDGQWDFKLVDAILGGLVYDRFVPQMVLVGITYSGENPDYDALRVMDLTPIAGQQKGSGDGPKFYEFLRNEALPYIEGTYRIDTTKRVLMGSSLGGLFTLYAMMKNPSMFSSYMAASPAVTFGNGILFKQESEFANSHKELPVRLYVGVGGDEGLTQPVKEFMQNVESRRYSGFKHEFRVFDVERHASNKPELYNRGLRFLFAEN